MTDPAFRPKQGARIVATIEARMNSSRLPGKVLLTVHGRSMLARLVGRLRAVPHIDEVVIATTTNPSDDILVEAAQALGVRAYRGSEVDVLGRVLDGARAAGADVIVQITGDCPIIDPRLVSQTIELFLNRDVALASNSIVRSFPDGMDTQVFTTAALAKSDLLTDDPLDREHVSRHMIRTPQQFPHEVIIAPKDLYRPDLGLTLDEFQDFQLLKAIIEELEPADPAFGLNAVMELLRAEPDLVDLNSAVSRKGDN